MGMILPVNVGGATDPHWDDVKALPLCQAANGVTAFTDAKGRHVFTAAGDAQISTAQTLGRGVSSGLCDGTGDSVSCPDSADFAIGTGPFTGEMFVRPRSLPGSGAAGVLFSSYAGPTNKGWGLSILNNSGTLQLRFFYSTDGSADSNVSRDFPFAINTDYYVAFTLSGSIVRLFAALASASWAPLLGATGTLSGAINDSTANFTIADIASGSVASDIYWIGPRLTAAARSTGSSIAVPRHMFPTRGA